MSRIGILFCLAAGAISGLARGSPLPGDPAPAFIAVELDGTRFDLAAMKGKGVILAFFATWCDGCHEELSSLGTLYSKYHSKGLEVLAVSLDKPREKAEIVKMTQPLGFPTALISDTKANGFGQVSTLPLLIEIDRAGMYRGQLSPPWEASSAGKLEAVIAHLLGQ